MTAVDIPSLVPPLPRWNRRRRDALLLIAVVIVGTVISLTRIPSIARHVVWAEDGARFAVDALDGSTSWQLLLPYAGYLHFMPRLIAEFSETFLPLSAYAIAISSGSAIVTGLIAGAVYWCSRSVTPWVPARLAFAAITVLAPTASIEVLGNVANLHWYFLWLAPWLLLYRPERWSGAIVAGIIALIASLTELQLVVFLPLALWHFRDRKRWVVYAGFAIGLAAQIGATLSEPRPVPEGATPEVVETAAGYLYSAVMGLVTGAPRGIDYTLATVGWAAPIALFAAIVAAWVFVLVKGTGAERALAAAALPGSIVLWCAGFVSNVRDPIGYAELPRTGSDFDVPVLRYGFVPGLLLASILVLAACVLRRTAVEGKEGRPGLGPVAATAICVALIGVFALGSTFATPLRATGASWTAQVAAADAACDDLADSAKTEIALDPAGWSITLTCSQIEDR